MGFVKKIVHCICKGAICLFFVYAHKHKGAVNGEISEVRQRNYLFCHILPYFIGRL